MSVQTFPCVFIEYVGVMVVNWRDVERQEDREVIPRKWDTSSFFFLKKESKKRGFFLFQSRANKHQKELAPRQKKLTIREKKQESGVGCKVERVAKHTHLVASSTFQRRCCIFVVGSCGFHGLE